jgi:hypothetical protein
LTWQKDIGVSFLRKIAEHTPEVLRQIGRAYIQKLFDQATQEGGFSRAQTIAKQWENLGPQTKKLLYPNPGLRTSLDRFFLGVKMAAENPNPSGTALVNQVSNSVAGLTGAGAGIGLWLHSPLAALGSAALEGGYLLGGRAIAKLLYSPAGVRLLTGALKPEAPAAAALRASQILRIAGDDDVTPIPPGGPPSPPPAPGGGSAARVNPRTGGGSPGEPGGSAANIPIVESPQAAYVRGLDDVPHSQIVRVNGPAFQHAFEAKRGPLAWSPERSAALKDLPSFDA